MKTVSHIDFVHIIKIFCGLFEHHTEEVSEDSWCQDATLLHSTDDWKRIWEVTVASDLAILVFMQLNVYVQVLWQKAESILWSGTFLLCSLGWMLGSDQWMLHTNNPVLLRALLQRTNTMSVVLLLALKLHWLSGRCSSMMVSTSLFSRILARIFFVMESRVIPQ